MVNLTLVRQSGKAVKGEPVSILQHANGLPKQIAMRDSRVIGREDRYIYYTTDTNPGSSGAPVVSDQWFPVALHHRTVPDYNTPYSYVANRGIRISSIFEALDAAVDDTPDATVVLRKLETARDGLVPVSTLGAAAAEGRRHRRDRGVERTVPRTPSMAAAQATTHDSLVQRCRCPGYST